MKSKIPNSEKERNQETQARISRRNKSLLVQASILSTILLAAQGLFPSWHQSLASTGEETESIRKEIYVSYPRSGAKISSPATFIIGAAPVSVAVSINGQTVRTNKDGYFAHVVKLSPGSNEFKISLADGSDQKSLVIDRPLPVKALPSTGLQILAPSLQPSIDQGLSVGDMVIFKARATPGGTMSVRLGEKKIILSPALEVKNARKNSRNTNASNQTRSGAPSAGGNSVKAQVNEGLAAAYGKVFQWFPANSQDLYVGYYKIEPTDMLNYATVKFTLSKDGKTISADAPGKVSVIRQPYMAQTIKEGAVMRAEPGKARLTPLPAGVRLTIDGWQGKELRCLFSKTRHAWVESGDIAYEKGTPHVALPPARSYVQTINVSRDSYGDAVIIPLNQRLPFTVEQSLSPNKLTLQIYGAVADTDWVSQGYKKAFEKEPPSLIDSNPDSSSRSAAAGRETSPELRTGSPGTVDGVSWKQLDDDTYQVQVSLLGNRQWGYFASYHGTSLVLHIKNPPPLSNSVSSQNERLRGLTVCIDPGHGGPLPGAMGCSGVSEAKLNLAISQKLAARLEAQGARVIMTRNSDIDVDIYERVRIAIAGGADILLSVHNNSLPDGRDPWKEHGTSTYWYHPQSKPLAGELNSKLVNILGFPDIGSRYQNLALTRAHHMLAVLIEVGFMINPDEYSALLKAETQEKAASAIVEGLVSYLKNSKTE